MWDYMQKVWKMFKNTKIKESSEENTLIYLVWFMYDHFVLYLFIECLLHVHILYLILENGEAILSKLIKSCPEKTYILA